VHKIILDLYHGNYNAFDRPYRFGSRQSGAFTCKEMLEKKLEESIDPSLLPLFKEYEEACMHLMDACCEDDFIMGYRLGAQMLMAAWPQNNTIQK